MCAPERQTFRPLGGNKGSPESSISLNVPPAACPERYEGSTWSKHTSILSATQFNICLIVSARLISIQVQLFIKRNPTLTVKILQLS